MMNNTDKSRTMKNSDDFPYFCRWLAEVWSVRGVDMIVEMLQNPCKFWSEWEEYLWLRDKIRDYRVEVTKEEFLENLEIEA